jgi:hypothetical protein
VNRANDFRVIGGATFKRIGVRDTEALAAVGLVRVQTAWEEFLESTFVRYLCGAQSAAGYRPILRIARETTVENALRTLLGGQRFLGWSSGETIGRANRSFALGDPYATGVGAVSVALDDIATIRNRFVHRSGFAVDRFRNVVRRELGFVPRGMTPGRFLHTPNPSEAPAQQRFIDSYANRLLGAARFVAP